MGERKQADVFGPPLGETLHRSLEEPLRHTAIPEVWPDGQRTEEAYASPIRCEVRTD